MDTSTLPSGFTGAKEGDACLVFFLGGVVDPTGVTPPEKPPLVGFSSNPRTPFAIGGSRIGPFFTFDVPRLEYSGTEYTGYLDRLPGQTEAYYYVTSDRYGAATGGLAPTVVYRQSATSFWKPKTFQIISPGEDGLYGPISTTSPATTGVKYDSTKRAVTAASPATLTPAQQAELAPQLVPHNDNITNFSSGTLVD